MKKIKVAKIEIWIVVIALLFGLPTVTAGLTTVFVGSVFLFNGQIVGLFPFLVGFLLLLPLIFLLIYIIKSLLIMKEFSESNKRGTIYGKLTNILETGNSIGSTESKVPLYKYYFEVGNETVELSQLSFELPIKDFEFIKMVKGLELELVYRNQQYYTSNNDLSEFFYKLRALENKYKEDRQQIN